MAAFFFLNGLSGVEVGKCSVDQLYALCAIKVIVNKSCL